MRTDGKAEVQHYIGKNALLKNFAEGKINGQVYVFDKHKSQMLPRPTSIKKIAAERRFNDAETESGIISIESELTEIEDAGAPIIDALVKNTNLTCITSEQKRILAGFIAAQLLRVPRMREAEKQIQTAVVEKARNIAPEAHNLHEIESQLEKDPLKLSNFRHILGSTRTYADILLKHQWLILKNDSEDKFWISDCPVVLHNHRTFGPYGNLGLAVPGIEIYMPLSPQLTIAIWHHDIMRQRQAEKDRVTEDYARAIELQKRSNAPINPEIAATLQQCKQGIEKAELDHKAIAQGLSVEAPEETVKFQNWLQYSWSYRFLFSGTPNFDLAMQIAADQPDLKSGISVKVD